MMTVINHRRPMGERRFTVGSCPRRKPTVVDDCGRCVDRPGTEEEEEEEEEEGPSSNPPEWWWSDGRDVDDDDDGRARPPGPPGWLPSLPMPPPPPPPRWPSPGEGFVWVNLLSTSAVAGRRYCLRSRSRWP